MLPSFVLHKKNEFIKAVSAREELCLNCILVFQFKQSHFNEFRVSTIIQKLFILHGGNIRASCSKELSALLFPHVFVFNDLTDHLCHSVRYDLLYLKDGKLEMRSPTWACAWPVQPHLLIAPSRHSAQEVLPCRGEGCGNSVCEYGSPQRSPQGSPALKSSWAKGGNREAAALRPGICTAIQDVLILST